MLEVLHSLREKDFKTYIVTGGGQDFVRVYADKFYGVPLENSVGSALDLHYTHNAAGEGTLMLPPKRCSTTIFLASRRCGRTATLAEARGKVVWCPQAVGILQGGHFAEEGKRGYLVTVSL